MEIDTWIGATAVPFNNPTRGEPVVNVNLYSAGVALTGQPPIPAPTLRVDAPPQVSAADALDGSAIEVAASRAGTVTA